MLSVSQALVEHALERPSHARRFWKGPRQPTDGSPTGQAFARAQVGKVWPRPSDRSATQLLPRRAGQPFSCGASIRHMISASRGHQSIPGTSVELVGWKGQKTAVKMILV